MPKIAPELINIALWVVSALGLGAIGSLGSFVLSKYLLDKTLDGPWGIFVYIRKALGAVMLDGMVLYTGSFTSRLLMCHNCMAPYAAAIVTLLVALILQIPWPIGVAAWVAAIGGNIALFDILDVEYE